MIWHGTEMCYKKLLSAVAQNHQQEVMGFRVRVKLIPIWSCKV